MESQELKVTSLYYDAVTRTNWYNSKLNGKENEPMYEILIFKAVIVLFLAYSFYSIVRFAWNLFSN